LTYEVLAKVISSVIPAKAGTQNCLKILDSGFRRNDDLLSLSRVLQEAPIYIIMLHMPSNEKQKTPLPKGAEVGLALERAGDPLLAV
jgi:hypothetical protein